MGKTKQRVNTPIDIATNDMEGVYNSLVVDHENSKLPETVFKSNFLPYFAGVEEPPKDKNPIVDWIAIAGSPMSKVDIIDNKGEVLYTTPPVVSDGISDSILNSGLPVSDIMTEAELERNNIPLKGEKVLNEKLFSKTKTISNHTEWEDIYKRYGLVDEDDEIVILDEDDDLFEY